MINTNNLNLHVVRTLSAITEKVVEFLGYETVQTSLKEIWQTLNEWLAERYGGWKKILKTAFDNGVNAAIHALTAVKDEIVKVCRENHVLLGQLSKLAFKTNVTQSCITKTALKTAFKESTEQVVKQGVGKTVVKVAKLGNPVSFGADVAQAVLEVAGYEEAGKTVGLWGNVIGGGMAGAVGGPPGVALGALGGFAIWAGGEVVGGLIDKACGN